MQALIVLSLAFLAAWVVYSGRRRARDLPPGPPRLPVLGNMLQLGQNPHKSLAALAKTYGPLMSIDLGKLFVVVASSPEMAREVLLKQERVFSKPFSPVAVKVLENDEFSMPMLPTASGRWKKLRRVAKEKLFSHQALQATQLLRRERLQKLDDYISRCSGEGVAMNVGEATFTTMSNLMFATIFSIELTQYGDSGSDSSDNKKLREHVNAFTRYIGIPNIADFFSIFAPFDPQGLKKKITYHLGSLLELMQSLIDERLRARRAPAYKKKDDFLDMLLDLSEGDEFDLNIKEIKHLCMDLIVAGSDTTAATTEWSLVELLLHPDKLAKLKAELKSVVGDKTIIEESDIPNLPYLDCTIKEVLRHHPAAPLLAPHVADEETRVNGYRIPKNTKMFVNVWAITRDPSIWKDPDSFEPERFLDNGIDSGGRHFELVPFGSGRRICPGIPLASRMLPCMVATLCHNFDWKLEKGAESKQLQREDVFGILLQKKTPLRAIPIKV